MTLTELRYVVAVAEERHFGHAAESCHVSQPTLSLGVKKFEDELGVVLFERGRHEVLVTPAGRRIVEQARRVLAEARVLKRLASEGTDPLRGTLRLGAIYTIGPYLLPGLLPVMKERAPHLTLIVEENLTAVLTERLKSGALDVAVLSLPYDEPGIRTEPLYDEPFVVLMPASHPLASQESISIRQLEHETVLLLGKGHCFRDQILDFCPPCGKPADDDDLQHALAGGSLETIRYMVASGAGVTILPGTAACADRFPQRLLVIRRFAGEPPSRRVALAWRGGFTRAAAVTVLREAILASGLTGVRRLASSAD
ncbi:LysR substrate-binding domain-containing protein [Thiocystis violacea]|uniref:LysR substrate-binding domain-containing protein n=1 Tax=Thiocystis violacea TaxID=13725 RepID=UPI00190449CC|nr:LysR substrate-binding domain-containing protein [Thiocystis violacea]MBK1719852.1 LysR family transcriptional regulator [Thiocystis violacea]